MKKLGIVYSWVICIAIVIVVFVAISLLDLLLAVMYSRFYSNALFIVTFGVGGVFAAALGYLQSIPAAPVKNEFSRWSLIILLIAIGLLFFFPFAKIEGGEYAAAFKAYGATMGLASFLFSNGKVE